MKHKSLALCTTHYKILTLSARWAVRTASCRPWLPPRSFQRPKQDDRHKYNNQKTTTKKNLISKKSNEKKNVTLPRNKE